MLQTKTYPSDSDELQAACALFTQLLTTEIDRHAPKNDDERQAAIEQAALRFAEQSGLYEITIEQLEGAVGLELCLSRRQVA